MKVFGYGVCVAALLACSALSHAEDSVVVSKSTLETLKHLKWKQFDVDANAAQPVAIKDPLMPLNYQIFRFNMTLDHYILRPIAVQYQTKIPEQIRGSYSVFRHNLKEPWNATNHLLQGKPKNAAVSIGRFLINTLTSLGFADVAGRKNLEYDENDNFGTTLGFWGVKSGPYLMLPFFGPSTLRDTGGMFVDNFGKPLKYMDETAYYGEYALGVVENRAELLAVDSLIQGDQYAAVRDAYLQQRAYAVKSAKGEDVSDTLFAEEPNFDEPNDDTDFTSEADAQNANTSDNSSEDTSFNSPTDDVPADYPAPTDDDNSSPNADTGDTLFSEPENTTEPASAP